MRTPSVRTALVALLLLFAAMAQGAVVARLPWWGPGEPQLPALAVLAVALSRGARAGAVAGFATGLTVDLLPTAAHGIGQWAFVLCLLGLVVGTLAQDVVEPPLPAVAVGAVGAALAPVLFTLLGLLLGDPRADVLGALADLPAIALWTLLAAPVVLAPACRRRRGRTVVTDGSSLASLALR